MHRHIWAGFKDERCRVGLFFVHLFRFSILCFCDLQLRLLCSYVARFCKVQFLQYYAKGLARKNVSEMTYFVSSWI